MFVSLLVLLIFVMKIRKASRFACYFLNAAHWLFFVFWLALDFHSSWIGLSLQLNWTFAPVELDFHSSWIGLSLQLNWKRSLNQGFAWFRWGTLEEPVMTLTTNTFSQNKLSQQNLSNPGRNSSKYYTPAKTNFNTGC